MPLFLWLYRPSSIELAGSHPCLYSADYRSQTPLMAHPSHLTTTLLTSTTATATATFMHAMSCHLPWLILTLAGLGRHNSTFPPSHSDFATPENCGVSLPHPMGWSVRPAPSPHPVQRERPSSGLPPSPVSPSPPAPPAHLPSLPSQLAETTCSLFFSTKNHSPSLSSPPHRS